MSFNPIIFFTIFLFSTGSIALPQKEQVLHIGFTEEPGTLNPTLRSSQLEGFLGFLSIRSFAHYNRQSLFVHHLAKALPEYVGNELRVEIRQDAVWDDGQPVICEDFKTAFSVGLKFRGDSTFVKEISWDQ